MLKSSKILVVDDDEEICMMIKLILEHNAFSVLTLQRADKISEVLGTEPIELIILDMLIGDIKGTDICQQLKNNAATARIPILMLTALPDAEKICRQAGANAFISKPFEIDNLIAQVNEFVKHS